MIASVLKSEIENFAARVRQHPVMELARSGKLPLEVARRYVANTRFLVFNTPRHMGLARRRCEQLQRPAMAAHFKAKGKEEAGHHRWADADLAQLRKLFGSESAYEPSEAYVSLMAYLDSVIAAEPAGYLAYTLLAEYLTVLLGPEWVNVLNDHCGVPRNAMTVVTRHVELDQEHVSEGLAVIDELAADQTLHLTMIETLRSASKFLWQFCDELYAASFAPEYRSAS